MEHEKEICRSNLLLNRDDSALLVVDVQQKLVPLVPEHERLVWNIRRLLDGAGVLSVPVLATEQYPEKLGATVEVLQPGLSQPAAKLSFSCAGCGPLVEALQERNVPQVLVVGIETHVCVMQTVLDLVTAGYDVFVAVDAVAARFAVDHATALQRMQASGVTLTTVEAALFEWCQVAGTAEFKQISQIVRRAPPT